MLSRRKSNVSNPKPSKRKQDGCACFGIYRAYPNISRASPAHSTHSDYLLVVRCWSSCRFSDGIVGVCCYCVVLSVVEFLVLYGFIGRPDPTNALCRKQSWAG